MRRTRLRAAAGSLTLTAALVVAGCSSSGGDDPSSTGAAASTPAGGNFSEGLAAAKKITAANEKPPTDIRVTVPLKEKPETGKTFVYLTCALDSCSVQADGVEAATKAIGWNFKRVNFNSGDPATLVAGFKQALQYKPVAVGLAGLSRDVYESVFPEYRKAGVWIVTSYAGDQKYDDVLIGQSGAKDTGEYGQIIGNWAVADSDGKAKILLETVPDFPILTQFVDGVKEEVGKGCDCPITLLNNTISQVSNGQVVASVIAALQKDPSINYVLSANQPFLQGLPAALKAAGLEGKVKIAGESGDVVNQTNIKAGTEAATTGLAMHYGSWAMIDIVLRKLQGMDFDPAGNGGLPKQLLTKNVDFEPSTSLDEPADYAEQFKKLWLVG